MGTRRSDPATHISETISGHPVVLFMKGSPSFPQCGFSSAIVNILARHAVPIHAVDVLQDPELRQEIKVYSDWPTIPQLYVGGTFVGGVDIVREMDESGELAQLLSAVRVEPGTGPFPMAR
jgi:monothiol glutaredoxin